MRSFKAFFALGALCAAILGPTVVLADPCEGGHYEYDHGECYDKSGSTTGDMLKMYDDGDRLQQSIVDRSRSSFGRAPSLGASENRSPLGSREQFRAFALAAIRAQTFTIWSDSPAIGDLTQNVPAAERGRARQTMRKLLRDYRAYVAAHGFPPNVFATGFYFSMVAAYLAYGDRWSAPELAGQTWYGQAFNLASVAAVRSADRTNLQRLNDDLALTGSTLLLVANEARAHHDAAQLARVRKQALDFLIGFHRLDPRTTRLDDTACLSSRWMMAGSCDDFKFVITNGKAGHFALPAFRH